ncbi:unnamed protein product [Caenorhabditis auriculariae]|uniref:SCP domain-containing protein n=1 Tax=Caenorhabditis auriculariae TaxID=2777116 RepID=A0A8S1HX78_9PELO|nr:unnamed protein product [Caenorhabditis auriculariae]
MTENLQKDEDISRGNAKVVLTYVLLVVSIYLAVILATTSMKKEEKIEKWDGILKDSDRIAYLTKHNEIRSLAAVGKYRNKEGFPMKFLPTASKMPRLYWDYNLEKAAENRANSCEMPTISETGENIASFKTSSSPFQAALRSVEQMGLEILKYGIKENDISSRDPNIGHATLMLSDAVRRVGCALSECQKTDEKNGEKWYINVCRFDPPGNTIWKSRPRNVIYEEGPTGSLCKKFLNRETGLCEFPN